MSGFWFPHAKFLIATQVMDWESEVFKGRLLMANTTALADPEAQDLTGIAVPDNFDGTGYSDQTLLNNLISEDFGVAAQFLADPLVWTGLGDGTRQVRYIMVYRDGASEALRIPVFLIGRALGASHPTSGGISAVVEAVW